MTKSFVSVFMPVYNGEKYVKEAIDSVLSQTYPFFELLIINDGSTDGSKKIIAPYLSDPRIRYEENPSPSGLIKVRNQGLLLAKGPYFAPIDADDVWEVKKLEKQVAFLEKHPEYCLVGSRAAYIDEKGRRLGLSWRYTLSAQEIAPFLLFSNYFIHSSVVMRLSKALEEKYEAPTAEDFDLWVRMARKGALWSLPEVLAKYRVHQESDTYRQSVLANRTQKQIRKIFEAELKYLGLNPTEKELDLQEAIHFKSIRSLQELQEVGQWLIKIEEVNKKTKVYNKRAFLQVLLEKWLMSSFSARRFGLLQVVKGYFSAPFSKIALVIAPFYHLASFVRYLRNKDLGSFKSQKISVLHVLASGVGGGATHVFDLMVQQDPSIRQKLVVANDGGKIAAKLRALGHDVEELDIAEGFKGKELVKLIRTISRFQPSIVHCHGFRAALYGRLAAKLSIRRVKTLVTVHGFHFYYQPRLWKKWALFALEYALSPWTDHVIAVSKTDWKNLLSCRIISRKKSDVILNGAAFQAPSLGKGAVLEGLGLKEKDSPIIATVARLHYQKGVEYFLRAASLVAPSYPNARFLIIGDGPEREKLEMIAKKLGLFPHVLFLKNRDDVPELLTAVDIFVLASLWEGLPLSLLEAMSREIPIVATNVDGNNEVIEEGVSGKLVPPKNEKGLADAILAYLQDPQLARSFAKEAKKRWSAKFSLSTMVQKTAETYRQMG